MNWPLAGALSLIAISVGAFVGIEWGKREVREVAIAERPETVAAEVRPIQQLPAEIKTSAPAEREVLTDSPNLMDNELGGVSMATTADQSANERYFSRCHIGGGRNCVVDGDTIWMDGRKIRLLDIDAPETHPPRCDREAQLGEAATSRLQVLLNSGTVTAERRGDRDTDTYGRQLRVVSVDGVSVSHTLVREGLVRWYGNGRRSWC